MTTVHQPAADRPGDAVPAAVLFDMDGTLIDSEPLWTIAMKALAVDLGGELTDPTRALMVGQDMAASLALLRRDVHTSVPDHEIERQLNTRMQVLLAGPLPWRPGAEELLVSVRAAGVPTALVTATHRPLVDIMLPTLGQARFDVVVCGDEVRHNKPHPEPYLRAAELLRIDPAQAVAIEDSPTGAAAAEAAGACVLVVPSEVDVPQTDRRRLRPSLVGLTVAELSQMHSELREAQRSA